MTDTVESLRLDVECAQRRANTAEAEARRLRIALELIVSRHPDSPPGEHPAVDIAAVALNPPFAALGTQPPPEGPERPKSALSEPSGDSERHLHPPPARSQTRSAH